MEVTHPLTAQPSASSTLAPQRTILTRPRFIGAAFILFVGLNVPIIVYNELGRVLDTASKAWFIYHPVFMSLAAVGIPLTAVVQQRLAGYKSNKLHMYMMITAIACAFTGFFIIFTNKRAKNEAHFESVHGKFGLAWLIFAVTIGLSGLFALDADNRLKFFSPEAGISNLGRFRLMRKVHAYTGRFELLFGYLTVYLGWINFFGPSNEFRNWAGMILLLIFLTSVALFDPVRDYLGHRKVSHSPLSQGHRGA